MTRQQEEVTREHDRVLDAHPNLSVAALKALDLDFVRDKARQIKSSDDLAMMSG